MTPPALADAASAADEIAGALASPAAVFPDPAGRAGRQSPQSLAGGAAGIALLHVERARVGHGDWATARDWLAVAAAGPVTSAANAGLYFGAPALSFVFHLAASSAGGYRRALHELDSATASVTRAAVSAARARMARGEQPRLREFDLIRGLAGLGAFHLAVHPGHELTRDVLDCLAQLTRPLSGAGAHLPSWWTTTSPSGEPSPAFPGGHGNLGMSHGISAVLAVLSLAILKGVPAPGADEAARRICAWTDLWQQEDRHGRWWPGVITSAQASRRHVSPGERPRPSWCYGAAGTARAQQLAGLALKDLARQHAAEAAILAVLRDPAQLGLLTEAGLCHGTAGLLQSAWRMARDAPDSEIGAELPRLTARLASQLATGTQHSPELLDGTAGAALALHTAAAGPAPAPCWDAFLALT